MGKIYREAVEEADVWLAMGQGLLFQAVQTYPDKIGEVVGSENVPSDIFGKYLNPYGDKLVHLGAFYGGSRFTMDAMKVLFDEPSEEALLAGAFLATTLVGGSVEYADSYFSMADMAANYAGWYAATEMELDEGPTERAYSAVKSYFEYLDEYSLD